LHFHHYRPKFRLCVPDVRFPLNIINSVDGFLRLFGIAPFKIKRAQFIEQARRIVSKTDTTVFGNQDEFVRGVESFVNSVSEQSMPASGIFLLNGLMERILNTRETVTEYINANSTEIMQVCCHYHYHTKTHTTERCVL
jgi:hypothetical protein